MNDNLFLFDDGFITELDESASPGHLDQLELFYEDTEELFAGMTSVITASQMAVSYATSHADSSLKPDPAEPVGHLLEWPSSRCGLTSIIRSDQGGQCNTLQAVFPFTGEGVLYCCKLLETRLFSNRLEAQLVVLAGLDEELSLTFYDAHYLLDRMVYKKDEVYQFVLRGFIYHLMVNAPDPQYKGMTAIFPREELGADHYEVQGPVKEVKEFDFDMLGQKFWLVKITIANNSAGEDLDLDLVLTRKVLGTGQVPRIGDDISAAIWLQGHLSSRSSEPA